MNLSLWKCSHFIPNFFKSALLCTDSDGFQADEGTRAAILFPFMPSYFKDNVNISEQIN